MKTYDSNQFYLRTQIQQLIFVVNLALHGFPMLPYEGT
uniref:Uncharacterized protein n=1 Tax=Arundo donax TaxID=35708 RepID=A0A0A9GNA7_ARUDO